MKVLNIGNVANNGYNIAKLLNQNGVETDLLIGPYFHIGGCPEWEDAEFTGDYGDQFFPQWHKVDITNGFMRPNWAAQGDWDLCIKYLISKNDGKALKRKWYWMMLKLSQRLSSIKGSKPGSLVLSPRHKLDFSSLSKFGSSLLSLLRVVPAIISLGVNKSFWHMKMLVWHLNRLFALFRYKGRLAILVVIKQLLLSNRFTESSFYRLQAWNRARKYSQVFTDSSDMSEQQGSDDCMVTGLDSQVFTDGSDMSEQPGSDMPQQQGSDDYMVTGFDSIAPEELIQYRFLLEQMKPLIDQYDIVIGFATDGIWPLLAGKKYVAYEHGTIRKLPFDDSLQGRLCRESYQKADGVIVTNCDNNVAAEKLKLKNFKYIPHYMNECELNLDAALALRKNFEARFSTNFIIFHPPRQHWNSERDSNWEKANDRFIRVFAKFINEVNPDALGVFVEWGVSVDDTKALLQELNIESNVTWIEPVPHKVMIEYIHASDMVSDQFNVPSFGGIPAKTFLHRRAVLNAFDPRMHEWCFETMPPFLDAMNADEIFDSLCKVYLDPEFRKDIEKRSFDWYRREHSNEVIFQRTFEMLYNIINANNEAGQ